MKKRAPCPPAEGAATFSLKGFLPEELAQAIEEMAPDLYFGSCIFDPTEIRHRDHIGVYAPPGETRAMRTIREIGYAAYGVECRAPVGHEDWLLGRLEALHEDFSEQATTGELAPPMTGPMRAEFIAELMKQVQTPGRSAANVLACKLMLNIWATDWEIERPELARVILERLRSRRDLAWVDIPIRAATWN